MRVLAVTSLFPNSTRPLVAPYNRQQLCALGRLVDVQTFAPILTFPGARFVGDKVMGADAAKIPAEEMIDNLLVRHPRVWYAPGAQGYVGVPLYLAGMAPRVLSLRGKVDIVFSAWAHPDGCSAPVIAKLLGVPCVVKVQGSDIDLYSSLFPHKWWLRAMLPRVDHVVAVSRAMARDVQKLGVSPTRASVVYNGVDGDLFKVRDRATARQQLGIDESARLIVFVGNVLKDKGAQELAEAFQLVSREDPAAHLAVVGKGPLLDIFKPLGKRATLAGSRPLAEIPQWLAAADVVTLPSYHEGTPNVVIEALACGRRVVATDVGGIPDLLTEPSLGEMVPPKDSALLASALARAIATPYDPNEVASKGARGDWEQSARNLLDVLTAARARFDQER